MWLEEIQKSEKPTGNAHGFLEDLFSSTGTIHVTDQHGNPVSGAKVHVALIGFLGLQNYVSDATTDFDGNAVFPNVEALFIATDKTADVIVNYVNPATGKTVSGQASWFTDYLGHWSPNPLEIQLTVPSKTDIPPDERTGYITLPGILGAVPTWVWVGGALTVGVVVLILATSTQQKIAFASYVGKRGSELGGKAAGYARRKVIEYVA